MLANFASIERHRGSVESISGSTVSLSNGEAIEADLLLWGTGYGVDLSYFESPQIASIKSLAFTGKDAASGKSWESWIRRYAEKKLAGEAANIESEAL